MPPVSDWLGSWPAPPPFTGGKIVKKRRLNNLIVLITYGRLLLSIGVDRATLLPPRTSVST